MKIDTKTAVILVLGAILVFALFQLSGTKSDSESTGAAIGAPSYGNSQYSDSAPRARSVNNIPLAVGGC